MATSHPGQRPLRAFAVLSDSSLADLVAAELTIEWADGQIEKAVVEFPRAELLGLASQLPTDSTDQQKTDAMLGTIGKPLDMMHLWTGGAAAQPPGGGGAAEAAPPRTVPPTHTHAARSRTHTPPAPTRQPLVDTASGGFVGLLWMRPVLRCRPTTRHTWPSSRL